MVGHQVETVSSGEEALEKLAIRTFDVVFTDLRIPGMADESARAIKWVYPHQVIVMVTAYANVISPCHKQDVLVDFMISKPFDLGTLRSSLKRAHELNKETARELDRRCLCQARFIQSQVTKSGPPLSRF